MNEKTTEATRISGTSPTVFYDAAGNEYPVADRPVVLEHAVWASGISL